MYRPLDTKTEFSMTGYPDKPEKLLEKADVEEINIKPVQEIVKAEPYKPDVELVKAVNLAIALGRPLLLQGDPGCGKTRLAYVVAYALNLPLEKFYIKSTSRAQDLLYTYDAVSRLYDAEMKDDTSKKVERYIHYGPLGRAIIRANYNRRSVLLLDEIDKADLDFPNDLLWELDRLEFRVMEDQKMPPYKIDENKPELRPIILITHNEEKPLPAAFLRRCIFHYVEFPKTEQSLLEILKLHHIDNPGLSQKAVDIIRRLRSLESLSKKPGLSELIDWTAYLAHLGLSPEELEKLPYADALLKQRSDQKKALEQFAKS